MSEKRRRWIGRDQFW